METQQRSEAPGYLYFLFSFLSSYLFRTFSLPQFFPFLLLSSIPPLLLFPLLFSFFFFSIFSLFSHHLSIFTSPNTTYSLPHPAPQPCFPQVQPPGLGWGGSKESSAQGALGVLFVTSFQVSAGGLAAVSLEAEGHRGQGENGWLGSEPINCLKGTHPHEKSQHCSPPQFFISIPPSCNLVQQNQLTDLRPPDLSKMSRARELKA